MQARHLTAGLVAETMAKTATVDQLVLVTAAANQAGALTERLVKEGFQVTRVSRSGVLDELPVSLIVGLNRGRLPRLLEHVRESCHRRVRYLPSQYDIAAASSVAMIEVEVGGAEVYVLDVERFEQF